MAQNLKTKNEKQLCLEKLVILSEQTKSFGDQIGKWYLKTMLSTCTHVSSQRGKVSVNDLCTLCE